MRRTESSIPSYMIIIGRKSPEKNQDISFHLNELNRIHETFLTSLPRSVAGSPFLCSVSDAARVLVSGEGLEKVAVGRPASFTVEADARPDVAVLGPARRPVHADVTLVDGGKHRVSFAPADVGTFG
jgi:hypothetical protein